MFGFLSLSILSIIIVVTTVVIYKKIKIDNFGNCYEEYVISKDEQ